MNNKWLSKPMLGALAGFLAGLLLVTVGPLASATWLLVLVTAGLVVATWKQANASARAVEAMREQAVSTRALAEAGIRPELMICRQYEQPMPSPPPVGALPGFERVQWTFDREHWNNMIRARIVNTGPGRAFDVCLQTDDTQVSVAPMIPSAASAYCEELLTAEDSEKPVTLWYSDCLGTRDSSSWVYEKKIANWRVSGDDDSNLGATDRDDS